MRILLLRHGETPGNLEKRYVGKRTDEGLTGETIQKLKDFAGDRERPFYAALKNLSAIYESPMRRCVETAGLLFPAEQYPGVERRKVPGLEECDFGLFEYKNYRELKGNADYQRYLDSQGMSGFPGGETTEEFRKRSRKAFAGVMRRELARQKRADGDERTLVFSVHGGTIMAVMEAFARPSRDYFSWQVKNLSGYVSQVERRGDAFILTDIAKVEIL